MGRLAAWVLLCASVAASQPAPDGRKLLDEVVAAYTAVRGYELEAAVINRMSGAPSGKAVPAAPPPAQTTIAIAYSAPDRLMLQDKSTNLITSYHDHGTSIFDGRSTIFRTDPTPPKPPPPRPATDDFPWDPNYDPPPLGATGPDHTANWVNEYTRRSEALARIGYTDYTAIGKRLESARVLRQEDVTVDGASIPCTVIEATYPHKQRRTFWVDTARQAVLREVDYAAGTGHERGAVMEHSIEVLKLNWDQPLPDSLFALNVGRTGTVGPRLLNSETSPHCDLATEEARIAGLRGVVTVSFSVDIEGRPSDIQVVQPLGLGTDELAVECVSQSLFRPAERDGKPFVGKAALSMTVLTGASSDWYLGGAVFQPQPGATRPVFLKTSYPLRSGVTGHTVFHLSLVIDKTGIPRSVEVTGGNHSKLDQKAVHIVSSWRFEPGQMDLQPVDVPATFDLVLSDGLFISPVRSAPRK